MLIWQAGFISLAGVARGSWKLIFARAISALGKRERSRMLPVSYRGGFLLSGASEFRASSSWPVGWQVFCSPSWYGRSSPTGHGAACPTHSACGQCAGCFGGGASSGTTRRTVRQSTKPRARSSARQYRITWGAVLGSGNFWAILGMYSIFCRASNWYLFWKASSFASENGSVESELAAYTARPVPAAGLVDWTGGSLSDRLVNASDSSGVASLGVLPTSRRLLR